MITFIPKRQTTVVYDSRIIKRRSSFSMPSFFPINDFYIIKPASIDFLLEQIYIKLPNNSFLKEKKVLVCFALDNTRKIGKVLLFQLKENDLSALEMLGAITNF